MIPVEQPKRDFKTITATKNRIVKAIKACDDDEMVVDYIQKQLPEAIEEYVSVVLEAAGLDSKIQTDKNFQFLGKLNFRSMLTADRLFDTQVKETKVISLLEEVQKSNGNLGRVYFDSFLIKLESLSPYEIKK